MASTKWSRPDPTSKDGTSASRGSIALIVIGSVGVVALVLALVVFGGRALSGGSSGEAGQSSPLTFTPEDGSAAAEVEKLREQDSAPALDATSMLDGETTGLPAMHQQQALAFGQVVASLSPGTVLSADKPEGLSWANFGAFQMLPVSPQTGPSKMNGHCTSGFARTIAGAAVAVVQLGQRATHFKECSKPAGMPEGSDDDYWRVLRPSLADGGVTSPQAAKMLAGIGRVAFSPQSGPLERVDIEIIQFVPGSGQSALAMPMVVRWKNGDWKLVEERSQFAVGNSEGAVPTAWTSWIK